MVIDMRESQSSLAKICSDVIYSLYTHDRRNNCICYDIERLIKDYLIIEQTTCSKFSKIFISNNTQALHFYFEAF